MFSLSRISSKAKGKVQRNPEENVDEDEDLLVEKARVKEALTCQCCEEVGKMSLVLALVRLRFHRGTSTVWKRLIFLR